MLKVDKYIYKYLTCCLNKLWKCTDHFSFSPADLICWSKPVCSVLLMVSRTRLVWPATSVVKQTKGDSTILTYLYRAIISSGHTPYLWRTSKVMMLPKPGKSDYSESTAFRPISLTPFFFKTLERLTHWHLQKHPKEVSYIKQTARLRQRLVNRNSSKWRYELYWEEYLQT